MTITLNEILNFRVEGKFNVSLFLIQNYQKTLNVTYKSYKLQIYGSCFGAQQIQSLFPFHCMEKCSLLILENILFYTIE